MPAEIDFSNTPAGYTVTGASQTNGNCPFNTAPCSHVNDNETITITRGGNLFDVLSATFRFQGQGNGNGILFQGFVNNMLTASADFLIGASSGFGDGSLSSGSTPIAKKVDYLAAFNAAFSDIDTLTITSAKVGNKSANVRVDSIKTEYAMAAVPVPAAGLLLFGALGGLAGLKRRRRAA